LFRKLYAPTIQLIRGRRLGLKSSLKWEKIRENPEIFVGAPNNFKNVIFFRLFIIMDMVAVVSHYFGDVPGKSLT
jgi:hypothetical protein